MFNKLFYDFLHVQLNIYCTFNIEEYFYRVTTVRLPGNERAKNKYVVQVKEKVSRSDKMKKKILSFYE